MIFAKKLAKYPIFIIFFRKINNSSEFYMIFARKMPGFYLNNFRGARAPHPAIVSYAYAAV